MNKKKYQLQEVQAANEPPDAVVTNPRRISAVFSPDADKLASSFTEMRRIRDTGTWVMDGAHSFREWCVIKFGDKIGCWLDDNL